MHRSSVTTNKIHSASAAAMTGLVTIAAFASCAAASTYQIYGEGDEYVTLSPYMFQEGVFGTTSSVPVSNSVRRDINGTYPYAYHTNFDEFAAADQAGAHVSSVSDILMTAPAGTKDFYRKYESFAYAYITISDLIISGAPTATTVATAVHMHLDGSLLATTELDSGAQGMSSSTSISADLLYNNASIGTGTASATSANGSFATHASSGLLTGYTGGSTTFTSSTFNAPVNTPFSLQFKLSADSLTYMTEDESGQMIANTDFGDTFTFSSDQPVFSLPLGYTADSLSAGIVANQYVPLPEPAAASLVAGVLLAGARRRRNSQN